MNNAYALTASNLTEALPRVLKEDANTLALGMSASTALEQHNEELALGIIYNRIDYLPEAVLDILARDFKVDWYDFDYNIEAKRRVLKSSFYVHRHLGTLGAVNKALGSIYPHSTVEEWFDYAGEPYSFRVILNMSVAFVVPIDAERVLWAINFYKSLRSHADGVYYRSSFGLLFGCTTGYIVYGVRLCGTFPERATQGGITDSDVVVQTQNRGVAYAQPYTGEQAAGTFPMVATQGGITDGGMVLATDNNGVAYAHPLTGEQSAGVFPNTATQGGADNAGIAAVENGLGVAYTSKLCGSAAGLFF